MGEAAIAGSAVVGQTGSDTTAPRIRPGGIAAFYAWADRLPGHGWWLYPALAGALLAWSWAILWVTGRLPVGTFDPTITASVAYGPYGLGALAYLNRVAGRALEKTTMVIAYPKIALGLLPVLVYLLTRIAGGLIGE